MHIDSLNYFYQVAISKSISTVAKNAHISQSALSQQISKLENKLNVQLFERTHKGVTLTPEGEILFKYSESILSTYNKMQKELLSSIHRKKLISIEAVESIGLTILPMAISKLKKLFTSHSISLNTINCCSNSNLLSDLCDISIRYSKPENAPGIVTKLIGTDEILLVANKSITLDTVTKDEVFELPLIFISNDNCLKPLICNDLNWNEETLEKANILYNTNSYFSALKGVSTSKAATFIPASIYYNYHSLSNVKIIKLEGLSLALQIYLSYSDFFYKTNSEFVKSLKNALKGYLN